MPQVMPDVSIKRPIAVSGPRSGKPGPSLISRAAQWFYDVSIYHILRLDLDGATLPTLEYDPDLFVRELFSADLQAAADYYGQPLGKKKTLAFLKKLQAGYFGLGVWQNGVLVGIDWISGRVDTEFSSGLKLRLTPGSCFGLDLEDPVMYQRQGLGLAALSYVIARSREMRFRRQFMIVKADDQQMLAMAGLTGFKKVGEIQARKIMGRKRPRWKLGSCQGRGGVLLL